MRTKSGLNRHHFSSLSEIAVSLSVNTQTVTPFESEGRPFDPPVHVAMNVVESDERASGAA
jgi:molecular chaperone GrpE (heat shock protein)